MTWSDFDKLASLMLKQMGKSAKSHKDKGKGKGAKGGQGGQGGQGGSKGSKGNGKGSAVAAADLLCNCCGKNNHVKSECRHKDKTCDNCGKTGHLKAVCRLPEKTVDASTVAAPGPAAAARTAAVPAVPKAFVTPWVCGGCLHQNPDPTWPSAKSVPGRKRQFQSQSPRPSPSSGRRCST